MQTFTMRLMTVRSWAFAVCCSVCLFGLRAEESATRIPDLPAEGNFSDASLVEYQQQLVQSYGGDYRSVPLDIKAEYFEDVMWKYHVTSYDQIHPFVILPTEPTGPPDYYVGADISTWNGACLAALSYKYAVTKDPETLQRIVQLLQGLHFFQKVTRYPGLLARCVVQSDQPKGKCVHRYVEDGVTYFYRTDPAKGTYNQVVAGYCVMFMLVGDDLPPDVRKQARIDLGALVWHVIKHDYKLTEADGDKTPYGDLTPLVGPKSIPFNAQLAYMMVAAGYHFPPDDPTLQQMYWDEFKRLRIEHHVYYENPATHLVCPQRVGANPIVKGMNDRNHVLNAAYVGIMMELIRARKRGVPPDRRFVYELGRTVAWTMRRIKYDQNALCNFMWLGLLSRPENFAVLTNDDREQVRAEIPYLLASGIEQLRRFRIDRFTYTGEKIERQRPTWVDERRSKDGYYWKSDPREGWIRTPERSHAHTCSIDYLHAYWLMRYFQLDQWAAQLQAPVLPQTPLPKAVPESATETTPGVNGPTLLPPGRD